MNDIPIWVLFVTLALLMMLSAFFSGSETALMTLNRYKLRHRANQGHKSSLLIVQLLKQPDRLIGLILLGNNFVNILASAIATILALRLGGEAALAIATGILTLVVLIFAEVTPKTLAALHPEKLAYPAAWVYTPLLKILYPLVWVINLIANNLLRLLGVYPENAGVDVISREELRTVVHEAQAIVPSQHQKMLLNLLDLERATVDDIMIPRHEIDGINLNEPWEELVEDLRQMPYTRALVYRGSIDHVVGFIHARRLMRELLKNNLNRENIEDLIRPPYYIPEGTSLNTQLLKFQQENRRSGLIVDEYGDVLGLITINDLLEEIVGQFTSDPTDSIADVQPQKNGSFLVDGSTSVRELVRTMHWELATDGPRTFNGLIMEQLEDIPVMGTSLLIAGYPVEVLQMQGNAVKTARIEPGNRQSV